jgi:hypothetical protein
LHLCGRDALARAPRVLQPKALLLLLLGDGELNRCKQKSCLAVSLDIKFLIAIFNCGKWQSRATSFRDFEIKFCAL